MSNTCALPKISRGVLCVALTFSLLLFGANGVLASAVPASAILVQINAAYGTDTGGVMFFFPWGGIVIEGSYSWSLEEPVVIMNATNTLELTTVETLNLVFNADPAVTLNFSVVAGNYGADITVTSGIIVFDPIVNPLAYATAGVTVTDNNINGATLTGLFPGGAAYRAYYNNPAVTWASLLATPVSAATGGTGVATDRRAGTIPKTVDRISSQFKFHLTASDSAAGTSKIEINTPLINTGRVAFHCYGAYLARTNPSHPGDPYDYGHIYVYDFKTLNLDKVTRDKGVRHAMNPHFSPDGAKLVFMAVPEEKALICEAQYLPCYGNCNAGVCPCIDIPDAPDCCECLRQSLEIYEIDLRTLKLTRLTDNEIPDEDPKYSPDGASIVFKRNGLIYLMPQNASWVYVIPGQSGSEHSGPNYRPDGNKIVFWKGTNDQADICWISSNGNDESCLVENAGKPDYYPIFWNQDRILYVSHDESGLDDDLYWYDIPTDEPYKFSFNSAKDDSDPFPINTWFIGFSTTREGGAYKLYVVDTSGGTPQPLFGLSQIAANQRQLGGCYSPVPSSAVSSIPKDALFTGQIKDQNGQGVAGVLVTFAGELGSVLTNVSGYFAKLVPFGWSGTVYVAESLGESSFNLNSVEELRFGDRIYNYVGGDLSDQDFVGWMEDISAPVVSASSMEIIPDYMASTATAELAGIVTDDEGILSVTWSCEVNGQTTNGTCDYLDGNWTASIPLLPGQNNITIAAQDPSENVGTYRIVADFNPCTDDDLDGVCVQQDLCPNTIRYVIVDEFGCPELRPGDFDRDGDVDQSDFDVFQSCASAPGIAHNNSETCLQADFDLDGDVDQDDFAVFQRCYSGENIPATPPEDFDYCPQDPDKLSPGVCGCGVPDVDSDSDGHPDCVDACPADPNKWTDPGVCGCGVDDSPDADGDGVPDCID